MVENRSLKFKETVKFVEFFPFEWSSDLLAVGFRQSIRFYRLNNSAETNDFVVPKSDDSTSDELTLIKTFKFEHGVEHFSWSPRTVDMNQIEFAMSDNAKNLSIFKFNFPRGQISNTTTDDSEENEFVTKLERIDAYCVHRVCFDYKNGELLAYTADNICQIWDIFEKKKHGDIELESPGVNIAWNSEEKTKFIICEMTGVVRIYSTETLRPLYTLMCTFNQVSSLPMKSLDWCQLNPELIIAATNYEVFLWNSYKSCLPNKLYESNEKIRQVRISKSKENTIGFIEGNDASSKLRIFNFKTNQILCQINEMRLLNSFTFNAIKPLLVFSSENVIKIQSILENH